MRIHYPLFVLIFILYPNLTIAKEENSKRSWSGPLIVVLYIGLILLTAAIAVWLRRYRDSRLLNSRQQRAGLESEEIDSLPSLRFSEIKMHGLGKGDEKVECAVCLNEFKDEELLRVLPDCYHAFHPHCIAPWLATHITCPICRSSLEQRQGSSISRSSIIDGISGPFSERFEHRNGVHDNYNNNNDNQFNVQNEGSSNLRSAEVNIVGSSQVQINCCIGTLPRSHSTGDLMVHMVRNFDTPSNIISTTLLTKECSPKSEFRKKVNKVDHCCDNISPKSDSFIDYSSINV